MLALANNFLAGSLLTLVLPVFVFIVILGLLTYMVVHVSTTRREAATTVPGSPQPASPGIGGTGERARDPGQSA
jgi:hypothetical protein